MENPGNMLAQFGTGPSLLDRVEAQRNVRSTNALNEYKLGAGQRAEQSQNRLRSAYGDAMQAQGDPYAEIAREDPGFHQKMLSDLAALDDTKRKQLAEEIIGKARIAMQPEVQNNPQLFEQLVGVPHAQRDIFMARSAQFEEVFNALEEQRKFENVKVDSNTGQWFGTQGGQVTPMPGARMSPTPEKDPTQFALDRKADAIMQSGVTDRALAMGIAAGRYVQSRDPISGEVRIVDMASAGGAGLAQPSGGLPPQAPSAPGQSPHSMVPADVNPALATGAQGALTNAVNTVADSIGLGLYSPKAREATSALSIVKIMTQSLLQEPLPGRPTNYLMQMLEKATVTPNSLLEGSEGAKVQLEQTANLIKQEIDRIENDILPRNLTPTIRVNTEINLTQLHQIHKAHKDLLAGFDRKAKTEMPAPLGVAPEIWDAMTPEQRKLFGE